MASDYPAKIILIGHYSQEQEAGTAQERAEWSDELYDRFDHHIVSACTEAGYSDPSDEARAIMAVMASMAPGTKPKDRARAAVRAYLEYRGW